MFGIRRSLALAPLLALLACADAPAAPPAAAAAANPSKPAIPADDAPLGLLPGDVKPTHYTLVVQIEPELERFSGSTEIAVELQKPRSVIWMHAKELTVKGANVRAGGKIVRASLEQVHPSGLARLTLAEPLGPGAAVIHVDYDAPFTPVRPEGLYRVEQGKKHYAVTQLEAISARRVFPSFDQPSFKTPFDVTLFVPKGDRAITNEKMIEHVAATPKLDRVTFATTRPIPSYLIAFAVGPWDVVDAPAVAPFGDRSAPVPLRTVATDGRGKEAAFANAHTGEILGALERYAGTGYPYGKLDLIAVPGSPGAMENPGAVTFRDSLILLPEKPSVDQVRDYYDVTAHELAHQWFGDIVTARWWDDIWLNEAFATWMSAKIVAELRPDLGADVDLLSGVRRVMGLDALANARQIRQPIKDNNDITNAFDGITYVKGAAVLGMFERWLGKETFQKGLRKYLADHRFQAATVDDLMTALSSAAGRDVGTPFHTFLDQPGVPLVKTKLVCGAGKPKLHLTEERWLPPGSSADANKIWQVPVCAKFAEGGAIKESCTLLTSKEGDLELPTAKCPSWVMPNADGVGYYRFEQPPAEAKALAAGLAKLGPRDKMSFSDSVFAAYARSALSFADAMELVAPFANDPEQQLAGDPSTLAESALPWIYEDKKLLENFRAYVGKLYAPAARRLGWEAKKGENESSANRDLRVRVLMTMAEVAYDLPTRGEAAKRGRAYLGFGGDNKLHPEAVAPDLAKLAVEIAAQDGDAAFFDAMIAMLDKTDDQSVRDRILIAMGMVRTPALAERARKFTLEPRLRTNEWFLPLQVELEEPDLREAAWSFIKANVEVLLKRPTRRIRQIAGAGAFCDDEHAKQIEEVFGERAKTLDGAPRVLAVTVEQVKLCAKKRASQEKSARAFFAQRR